MKSICLILILIFLASCNKSGSKAFESLEETPDSPDIINDPSSDGPIVIDSVTPTDSPYILTGGLDTFAIQIASGAGGSVTYDFRLDGISVQDSTAAFYVYNSAGTIAGAHTLEVVASNPTYSESHVFHLYRNSPPVLNLVNNTATTITCVGGTFTMNLSASDVNGDPLTFTFYHNGSTGSVFLANGSGATTATTTFTPNCSVAGNNNIKVRVTDAYGEYDEETVAVTVSNPTVASITSYSPLDNTVIITQSSPQQFQISPDGTSPFEMVWTLDNGVGQLVSCNNDAFCDVDSDSGARVGSYTLNVELTDQGLTPAQMDFDIFFNAPPVLAGSSPSSAAPVRFSCDSTKTFQVNVTDQNGVGGPASHNHSITWYYNDAPVTSLALSSFFSVSTNVAVHPFDSTLTFTPNCASAVFGDGVIKAVYSDNIESGEESWNVHTSFLSTECLNLDAGEICTVAGIPGISDDVEVGTTLVTAATINGTSYLSGDTNPNYSKVRIRPNHMEEYVSGGDKGLFITDTYHHTVWFYNNNSSGNITVNGVTVGPKKIKILVGNGAPGFGINGETGKNFYLNRPMGVAFDSSTGNLYVADYGNSRILKISNTGTITNYTNPASTSSTDGDAASLQKCLTPVDLEISNGRLYATCYGNIVALDGAIKYFNLANDQGTNVVMYAATNAAGVIGVAAAARPWSLAKHPNEETIFFAVYLAANCNIGVINNTPATNNTYTVATAPTTISVNSGEVNYFMSGGNNCATTVTVGDINTAAVVRLREYGDIEVKMDGATFQGLFVSQQAVNYVAFMNLSGSSVKVANRIVSEGKIDRVLGTGTAGKNYVSAGYTTTLLNAPRGLSVIGSDLYVADTYNFSVAKLDIGAANGNGVVSSVLGTKAPYGYDGEIDGAATSLRLAGPSALSYDSSRNRLYFSEVINPRIRYIDLEDGRIRSSFGSSTIPVNLINAGSDTTSLDPLLASLATGRLIQDLSMAKNIQSVFFTDVRTDAGVVSTAWNTGTANTFGQVQHTAGTAATQMCHLRAFNDGDTDRTIFGKSVPANYVTILAGDQTSGCHNWNQTDAVWSSTIDGQGSIAAAAFGDGASGVLTNDAGTVSYVAMKNNHCITQVGTTVTRLIGKCNSGSGANTGSTNGAFLTARLNSPGDLEWDPLYPGNFFIADRTLTTGSLLRYVNATVSSVDADGDTLNDASGSSVGVLTHGSIPTLNYLYGVAANDEMLCFSQGAFAPASTSTTYYNHNVICIDRVPGRGLNKTIGIQTAIATLISRNRMATGIEEEGDIANSSISMHAPMGLAFDAEGNLYIAENGSNTIKMVKAWY